MDWVGLVYYEILNFVVCVCRENATILIQRQYRKMMWWRNEGALLKQQKIEFDKQTQEIQS